MTFFSILREVWLYFKLTYREELEKETEKLEIRQERIKKGEISPFDSLGGGFGGGSSDD